MIQKENFMSAGRKQKWFGRLVAVLCAAGFAPGIALALEGKLTVQASPQVVYTGQSAQVNVFASFPPLPSPDGAYAFASSTFDVNATDPGWTFATAGAIVGNDVLGASASQAHMPQLGLPADPTNPIRVWHGTFTPVSNIPAVIEIEADPIDFSVYPSKLTSSSAPANVVGSSDLLFVNPFRLGRWLAAPAFGTTIARENETIVGQLASTGTAPTGNTPIKVYLCPSGPRPARNSDDAPTEEVSFYYNRIQPTPKSSTRVEFDQPPESFTATVQILGAGDDVFQWDPGDGVDLVRPDAPRSPIGSMTLAFDQVPESLPATAQGFDDAFTTGSTPTPVFMKVEMANALISNYAVSSVDNGASTQLADGHAHFNAFSGGVRVAAGELNGNLQVATLYLGSLPQTIEAHVQGALQSANGSMIRAARDLMWTLRYDQPTVATVLGPNGNALTVTVDRIEIFTQNNWRNPGLGCHVFEATGVQQMRIKPGQSAGSLAAAPARNEGVQQLRLAASRAD